MGTEKILMDTTKVVAKAVEIGIKKAWSILDAASEKKAPSEYLSQRAIKSIQGKS